MSEEMLEKLRNAESAEEIIAVAKEYDLEVTAEQAQELLDRLKTSEGELSDDLLETVAGGGIQGLVEGLVRTSTRITRKSASVAPSGIRLGRRALALRAADAGRGHMVRALGFAA